MTQADYKLMSDRIKKRREQLGFTQEQFAEMIGISVSSYSKIENAFQKPALNTITEISKKLNTSIDSLVFGTVPVAVPSTAEKIAAIAQYADEHQIQHAIEVLKLISEAARK